MRRALVLTAVFGAFLAGLGCNHIAGKCDCTHDAADAVIPGPSQPYPTVGQPAPTGPVVPVAPAPMPGN
ncbi:MAG TPA: hypothetical protein VM533_19885 [Fimbriiglobus sp.]|nr:hypothetical protein [Fimbriiglobus sp.]